MKKQKSTPGMEEHDLEALALSELAATHYKEAIRLFKKLLQTTEKDEWKQQLAYCYVQRSIQFSAKGMYKEAVVLWENHVPFTQAPYDANDQYIFWVIQTNNQANIQANLSKLSAQQLDKQYPALASVLGLLMLTEHPEFEQNLPQDSVFIAHFKIVQKALQAYQDNDHSILVETLKLLPYRSAFRDLRTLLNAASLMPNAVEQPQSLLAKISPDSVYHQPARIVLACTKEGTELAEYLLQLSHQQCAVIGEVKGFSKKQLEFIQQYNCQHDKLTDKLQFKLAIQFKLLIGIELAQHFCQGILPDYPAGKKEFKKHFEAVGGFDENRTKALICERDRDLYGAEFHWRKCLEILDDTSAESRLKKALILRHLASTEGDEEGRTIALEESLGYDPDDRQSYLHILQYYSQQPETAKEYKKWLDSTFKQFPQDVEILTQAVKVATRNKSYTKANQYATKILKIDPINTYAKQTLFASYLTHARGLMSKKSYFSVESDFVKAEKLNIGKAYQKQIQLIRALLCFANEDKQQGLQRIVKQLGTLHKDPVNSQFQAAMEAMMCSLAVATILRELPPIKKHLLSTAELKELNKQIEQYAADEDNHSYLHKALEKIKAPLKNSLSKQEYTEELLINLCKVLDGIEHFELIRHCVKSIPSNWNKLVWKYYRVYADTNGDAATCSHQQVQHLQFIHEEARKEKGYRTSILIEKYLDRYHDAHPQQGMGLFDQLFGGQEDDEYEPMEEIFGHLSGVEWDQLNKKAELIMKKLTPERLIQDLIEKTGSREATLIAVMQNPDILPALMILKAAEELKMDIDVDVDEVLEVFEVPESNNSFPFPFNF